MSNAAAPATDGPDRSGSPLHVAIIMDGNGRWAASRGLPRVEGHRRGVEALRRVVECQLDLGPIIPFVYSNPAFYGDEELAAILDTGDEVIVDVLDRVATQGTAGPPSWPRLVFWALLNAGYQAVADGTPRVQVVDAIMASLTQGTIKSE